jgi:hypothetical protein
MTIKNFAIQLCGNQGLSLAILYLVSYFLGLLAVIKNWVKKDLIKTWEQTLIIYCFLIPVLITCIFSAVIVPIFYNKYLLIVLPYFVILSSTGITNLLYISWSDPKLKVEGIFIGLSLLISIIALSLLGIKFYFTKTRTQDIRGSTLYLAEKCLEDQYLRLYYTTAMENAFSFYNPNLRSQISKQWKTILKSNTNRENIAKAIPSIYDQVCLGISGMRP